MYVFLFYSKKISEGDYLFTGPRYLSSQARVSLMNSFLGGIWSVSYSFNCLFFAGVPHRSNIGLIPVSRALSYLPFNISVGVLIRVR